MINRERVYDEQIALFYFAYKSFTKTIDKATERHSLKRVHHSILFFVGRLPGITTSELVTILDVSKQALHKPLLELKERKLLQIKLDKDDKRKRSLLLTERGRCIESEISFLQQKQMYDIFLTSGDKEGTMFLELMKGYAKTEEGSAFINKFSR